VKTELYYFRKVSSAFCKRFQKPSSDKKAKAVIQRKSCIQPAMKILKHSTAKLFRSIILTAQDNRLRK